MAGNSNYFIQGATALSPAMQDVMRGNQAYYDRNLASLNEQFQLEQVQGVARLGAERLAQYGPEGEQWAQALATDPYAAYALAESMGGFGAIEGRLAAARAQGAASEAIGQMQQAGASPQEIVGFILRTQGPEAAKQAADALGVGQSVTPKAVIDPETGQPIYVAAADAIGKQPVPRAPLVSIGGAGMKPEQAVAAEDRAASQVDSRVKPLEDALNAWDGFTAVYERIRSEGRDPTAAETDTLIKLAARLENPEAVQEGDIARKSGGGFMNFFRGKFDQPYQIDRAWMEGLHKTGETIAAAKRKRLEEIRAQAQEVARERGLSERAVAPTQREDGPPPGAVRDPSIPGLWILPDGSGYMED